MYFLYYHFLPTGSIFSIMMSEVYTEVVVYTSIYTKGH